MKLRILGAAGEVTGSNYMIETAGYKVLVDCGTHQGADEERHEGESFPYDPTGIDAVLLTHAHIDHSGRIPLLVKLGFKGKIYCTHATAELVEVLLRDSARIMKEDAEWRTRKNARKGLPPVEPLYSERDVEDALAYRSPLPYDEVVEILPGLGVRFREARQRHHRDVDLRRGHGEAREGRLLRRPRAARRSYRKTARSRRRGGLRPNRVDLRRQAAQVARGYPSRVPAGDGGRCPRGCRKNSPT